MANLVVLDYYGRFDLAWPGSGAVWSSTVLNCLGTIGWMDELIQHKTYSPIFEFFPSIYKILLAIEMEGQEKTPRL